MGVMTKSDFRTELADSLQETVASVGQTRLDRWVRQTIAKVAYAFPFPELKGRVNFSTVSGDYDYIVGTDIVVSDFRAMRDLGLWKSTPEDRVGKILPETRESWLRHVDTIDSNARGNPKFYHKDGNTIFLRPVPDATIVTVQLHYWKTVPAMGDGDVTIFSEEWDDIFLSGALALAFRGLGEFDRYRNARNDFLAEVRSRALEEDLEEFPGMSWDLVESEEEASRA